MAYYLDHAATTPLSPQVLEAMMPYLTNFYANPSSLHDDGIMIRKKINEAREVVANTFHVQPSGVIFTSGGTEATNLALLGYAKAHPDKKHVITSVIEHHATTHTVEAMREMGYEVDFIPVDQEGFILVDQLKAIIRHDTLLVSFIWGNNEIGTIQDVETLGQIAHDHGAMFHVDAVQMAGQTSIDLSLLPIDMMSISAHKFYGPKGIGALICNDKVELKPILHGGSHERGLRSGTENVTGIIGLAKALELSRMNQPSYVSELKKINQAYQKQLKNKIPTIEFNGPKDVTHRLSSILSISLKGVSSSEMQFALNRKGIYVSTGSACLSNEIKGSHVLEAIQRDDSYATIRLSFGTESKLSDVENIVQIIHDCYEDLREN